MRNSTSAAIAAMPVPLLPNPAYFVVRFPKSFQVECTFCYPEIVEVEAIMNGEIYPASNKRERAKLADTAGLDFNML